MESLLEYATDYVMLFATLSCLTATPSLVQSYKGIVNIVASMHVFKLRHS